MSRRDTIIIAVLVNAALLMILFATAVRSDDPKKQSAKEVTKLAEVTEIAPANKVKPDDLLNEYISSVPVLSEASQESFFCFEESEQTAPKVIVPPQQEMAAQAKKNIENEKSSKEMYVNVVVKKGDFLEKIAKANKTTVTAIMQANHLTSTQLKIGQVLKVPVDEIKNEGIKLSPTPQHTPIDEFYIVKEGDNPWLIASRNKIKLEELLRINSLDEQKAKKLKPGDKLKIR